MRIRNLQHGPGGIFPISESFGLGSFIKIYWLPFPGSVHIEKNFVLGLKTADYNSIVKNTQG